MSPITLRIKELRDAKGWSQAELARQAGVRRAMLNELEAGKRQRIDLEILEKLAGALGVNAAILVDHSPPKGKRG